MHGEYKHLKAQEKLAVSMGIPKENVFVLQSGNVLELSKEKAGITGQVKAGEIYVDGLGVGDVGNVVIKDRQNLSENGLIVVTIGIQKTTGEVMSGPDIVSRGFVYVKESDNLMNKIKVIAEKSLDKCMQRKIRDWNKIKSMVRDDINEYLWKEMKRNPMIMTIILEL